MRKYIFILLFVISALSCSSDDARVTNPFLPNVSVNFKINLNLPLYNKLNFPGGVYVESSLGGIKGVIIYNLNDQTFLAYELSDPNIPPSSCSALKVVGMIASSDCGNDNVYSISTGQPTKGGGKYPLLSYRIAKEGNILSVSN